MVQPTRQSSDPDDLESYYASSTYVPEGTKQLAVAPGSKPSVAANPAQRSAGISKPKTRVLAAGIIVLVGLWAIGTAVMHHETSPAVAAANGAAIQKALDGVTGRLDYHWRPFTPSYDHSGSIELSQAYVRGTSLLLRVHIEPWYDAGIDTRGEVAAAILDAWKDELRQTGIDPTGARVNVTDTQGAPLAEAH